MKKYIAIAVFALWFCQASAAEATGLFPELSLSLSAEYNNNIFLSHADKKSDFVTYVNPAVALALRPANSELRLGYSPSFNIYKSHDELNNTSHSAFIRGSFTLSDKMSVTIGDTFVRSEEVRDLASVASLGPIRARVKSTVNDLSGSMSYRLKPNLVYRLGGSYSDVSFSESGFRENKTYGGSTGLTYIKSERSTFTLDARYTLFDYKSGNDAQSQNYLLGVVYRVTPTLTVGLNGGAVITEIEGAETQETGFAGGVNITKTLERGSLTLSFTQDVVSGFEEGNPQTSQAVTLNLTRPLSPLWTLSLAPSYSKFKAVKNSDIDTEVINVSSSLAYNFRSWGSLVFAYNFMKFNDTKDSSRDYDDHRVTLTFRLHYERKQPEQQQEPLPPPAPAPSR